MANVRRAASIRPYSRFEAVAGHMWRCISQVRGLKSNQITKLYSQVDFRRRMRSVPLPQGYFGNAILRIAAASRSGVLLMNPLSYASRKIRESIESVSDEYVREAIDLVKIQPDTSHVVGSRHGAFYGNPNLEITSWVGIPLRRVDFGWGNEIHLCPAAVAFDGKSFIYSGGGSDVDESWMIAVRLQVAHMDAFKKIFYKDISDGNRCKL
ncbi:hydroxycinnamoyl-CoA:piscidic acid hydroxycinnamoyltransferase-like [Actinidia eriantha]|uniref:hydroxycinnamoyl-CoA:piscidic acid hydroxycinnamoyltransferase-like n=1 Tax=Actinidia eriantha TaxID=165200 RepID=UPI00258FE8C8|nr:hydroxycinnamoyl-CoA:piscidic acid hydroxycinnamoyltransferase-like [Actinidia eriantha]